LDSLRLGKKDSRKVLLKSFRYKLFKHMKKYAEERGILLDIINGVEDHVHCLLRLKTTQCVADIIREIKGESSFWVNRKIILDTKFEWQKGYGVFSVSPDDINRIRKYIYNQELHHQGQTYNQEVNNLIKTK
tara:strand:+ start:166 stop:561 length:396 start_codon:yes stop_codon:yes gene_type:complete